MTTDYETEKKQEATAVSDAARLILEHLAPVGTWHHDREKEARYDSNGWGQRFAWLTDGDRLIGVRVDSDDKARVQVLGVYTPERDDSYRQGFERDLGRVHITVSLDRLDRIGAEIVRRLLPKLDAGNVTYRERVAKHDAYNAARDGTLARLARAVGAEVWKPQHTSDDTPRLTWHYETPAGFGEATAYDDSATLELHNVSPDLAEPILALVKAAHDA